MNPNIIDAIHEAWRTRDFEPPLEEILATHFQELRQVKTTCEAAIEHIDDSNLKQRLTEAAAKITALIGVS